MSTVLTREHIRAVDDRKIEPVELPEWGGMLYVRGLSGKERDDFDLSLIVERKAKGKAATQETNLRNMRARLVLLTAVNDQDPDKAERVFQESDLIWLGDKNAAPIQRLFAKAQELSGLGPDDVEELTKELGETPGDGSGIDSPSLSDIGVSQSANELSPV